MANAQFDNLIHGQNRLQICATLVTIREVEFQVLKESLQVSDSVLSKHLKSLVDADYVKLVKRADMGRQRTWLSLTSSGRSAYQGHLQALRQIVGGELA